MQTDEPSPLGIRLLAFHYATLHALNREEYSVTVSLKPDSNILNACRNSNSVRIRDVDCEISAFRSLVLKTWSRLNYEFWGLIDRRAERKENDRQKGREVTVRYEKLFPHAKRFPCRLVNGGSHNHHILFYLACPKRYIL